MLASLVTMDDNGGKMAGIPQIARLKQLLQKWQTMALGPKDEYSSDGGGDGSGGILAAVNKRLKAVMDSWESDDDSCHSSDSPSDVPKGYMPVCVGPERRRFVIPMTYLDMPVFKLLLDKAKEEFGYDIKGALTLPCEIETFKYILLAMEHHREDLIEEPADKKE